MGISDDLTYGQRENMSHNLRALKRASDRFYEAFETVRRTAPAIAIGIEMNSAPSHIIAVLESNWNHYQTHEEWPDLGASATGKK